MGSLSYLTHIICLICHHSNLPSVGVHTFHFNILHLLGGCTHFLKIWDPSQNLGANRWFEATSIHTTVRHQHAKFNHPGDLAPEICTPLVLLIMFKEVL